MMEEDISTRKKELEFQLGYYDYLLSEESKIKSVIESSDLEKENDKL